MATYLSDSLQAAQLGAALIYHDVMSVEPSPHLWTESKLAKLLERGAREAQNALDATHAPGRATTAMVLGFLHQLAAIDASVPSAPTVSKRNAA